MSTDEKLPRNSRAADFLAPARPWPRCRSEPQLVRAAAPAATADAVIVLWMAGGMAQTETFDPKRYTPFAPGVRTEQVLSTFPAIDTAVDHIKFSQGWSASAE